MRLSSGICLQTNGLHGPHFGDHWTVYHQDDEPVPLRAAALQSHPAWTLSPSRHLPSVCQKTRLHLHLFILPPAMMGTAPPPTTMETLSQASCYAPQSLHCSYLIGKQYLIQAVMRIKWECVCSECNMGTDLVPSHLCPSHGHMTFSLEGGISKKQSRSDITKSPHMDTWKYFFS